ncbi:helix-turn-helix transcriptional regulator [Pseudoxanthomonas japonensis]|uniref:helix-turn-helix transcriptional regulator n=1 Tax=Pseudoxanthomonas japonensis TaxID=69284 RepID=UPI003748BDCB
MSSTVDRRLLRDRERGVIAGVLLLIALLVVADVVGDLRQGASGWHVALEILAAGLALSGALHLLRSTWRPRRRLVTQAEALSQMRVQAEAWRQQARRHVEGLSRSIDAQLDGWRLSPAEKEVAFLLLKGLGLREIADLRGTHEKTVRAQSASIYAKAGLAGRSELAAFFLEDLLVPRAAVDAGVNLPASPPAP